MELGVGSWELRGSSVLARSLSNQDGGFPDPMEAWDWNYGFAYFFKGIKAEVQQ